jgi:hypothetical protein
MQVFDMPSSVFVDAMTFVSAGYWLLDIIATLFVGYYRGDGELVMDRLTIARKYAGTWLWFDALLVSQDILECIFLMKGGSAPWITDSLGIARTTKLVRILRVVRVVKVAVRAEKLRTLAQMIRDHAGSENVTIMFELCRNIGYVVAINHFLGCMWYWVGTHGHGQPGWVQKAGIEGRDWSF